MDADDRNQPPSMIFLIFSTILFGVLVGVILHLRQAVNHVPRMIRDPPTNESASDKKKRLDDMLARWKSEGEEGRKKKEDRYMYLNSGVTLSKEEKEEQETMYAKELHHKESNAMNKGEISQYDVKAIYSPEVRRKEEEVREEMQRRMEEKLRKEMETCTEERRQEIQSLIGMKAPSCLGLHLHSKTPSYRRWNVEAECRASAHVGTVFHWLTSEVLHQPLQEVTYHLIRVNGEHRWIYLTVTREKTESLKTILADYLQTLDRELFHGAEPVCEIIEKPELAATWQTWNPATKSFTI